MGMSQINWVPMHTVIPEGKKGIAEIRHFTVSEADASFSLVRAMMRRGESVAEGTYAKLLVHGGVMMSDTQMEKRSNRDLIYQAQGHVLVAGLGLGMVVIPLLAKEGVTKVTVIEKHADVIDLVEKPLRAYLKDDSVRLSILQGDIFEWVPAKDQKFDTLYFDIWPDICGDNLKEMATLHRRFARRKTPGAWMESWQRGSLKSMARQQQRSSSW